MNNLQIGKLGEDLAILYLKQNNFEIIQRNWKILPYGEIDIIAIKQNILYFFEVKSTNSKNQNFDPSFHLTDKKIDNLRRSINFYIKINKLFKYEIKTFLIVTYINQFNKQVEIKKEKIFL